MKPPKPFCTPFSYRYREKGTGTTKYAPTSFQKPPEMIRDHFRLTVKQTEDVLAYIEQHREAVEAEYQHVLKQAEENRQYWQQRNAQHFKEIASHPRKPQNQAVWQKLEAKKKRAA